MVKVRLKRIRLNIGSEQAILLKCMSIALIFWIVVKMSGTYQTTYPVHLIYQLPAGKQFTHPPIKAIQAIYTGEGWELLAKSLKQRNMTLKLNLSDYPKMEIEKDELMQKIKEVSSLSLVDVSRNKLQFELDTTSVRKVPVKFTGNLKFATDFFIKDSIRMTPDSVLIWGPAMILDKIDHLKTSQLALHGIRADISRVLNIQLPAKQQVNILPESVEVFIPVEQFTQKEFIVPVLLKDDADSIHLVPDKVKVTCAIGLSSYGKTTANDFVIEADIGENGFKSYQNSIALNLVNSPAWVKNVQISPKAVEYFIIQ